MAELKDYITPAGWRKVRGELDELWRVERPRVTAEVSAAAALGDRSENAEYKYGKRRLRQIDARLRFLKKRLELLTVVRTTPGPIDRVRFASHVEVEDENGELRTFQVVGADESDADEGRISVTSPVGRALLGKAVDDEVSVKVPRGDVSYTVLSICFAPTDDDTPPT